MTQNRWLIHLKAIGAGLIGLAIIALVAALIVAVLGLLLHLQWLGPWLGLGAIVVATAWALGLIILSEVNVV